MGSDRWIEQRETILAIIFCVVVGGPMLWLMYQPSDEAPPEAYNEAEGISFPSFDAAIRLLDPAFGRVNTSEVESGILQYTNEERQKNGVAPLTWDDRLATIARQHSQDMVDNNYISHDNLEGNNPTDRARQYGYPLRKDLGGGWYSEGIGENINKMPIGEIEGFGIVIITPDAIARAQVDSWMESPGHRENILNPQYDKLGVGVVYDGHTYYYATQNFW